MCDDISMGEEARWEMLIQDELREQQLNYIRKNPGIWITQDERKIPISEMDDGHLSNVIRMLLKNCGSENDCRRRVIQWPQLVCEAKKRNLDPRDLGLEEIKNAD